MGWWLEGQDRALKLLGEVVRVNEWLRQQSCRWAGCGGVVFGAKAGAGLPHSKKLLG
jgi:hypothetical protein